MSSVLPFPAPHRISDFSGVLPPAFQAGKHQLSFGRPLVMGILNLSKDSFSGDSRWLNTDLAEQRAWKLVDEGADIIDLGGASSHPKARNTSPAEELERVLPVLGRLSGNIPVPLSIDTQSTEVAAACLEAGVALINDVSGLLDNQMAELAVRFNVPLVITYNGNTIPRYQNGLSFVSDMLAFFAERIEQALQVDAQQLVLDPGYGFGKSLQQNLLLLQSLPLLLRFQLPLLICTSRKGSLGTLVQEPVPAERLGASLASTLYGMHQGAHLLRVHDVKQMHQAVHTWQALNQSLPA